MWHRVLLVLFVIVAPILSWFVLIPTTPVKAATTADIEVTATPDFGGGGDNPGVPTNFTLTRITDYEVLIEWDKGPSANNTMIRRVTGRYPNDRTDGLEIYYGTGTSLTDFDVDLEMTSEPYFYRAWSEDTSGDWSPDYAEGQIGGSGVIFLALTILALGLTVAMFHTKSSMLGFPCLLFWAILGGYAYTESTTPWGDWQYYLFFASFGMAIFSAFAAFALRTKKEEAAEGDLYFDEGGDADVKFIDEGGRGKGTGDELDSDGEKPSRRTRDIRGRANRRRTRWE